MLTNHCQKKNTAITLLLVTLQANEEHPAEASKVLLYNQHNHISEGIRYGEVITTNILS